MRTSVAEMATFDTPMNRSPRTEVQRRRILPAKQYQWGRKFAVSSAREENRKLLVARNSKSKS